MTFYNLLHIGYRILRMCLVLKLILFYNSIHIILKRSIPLNITYKNDSNNDSNDEKIKKYHFLK